MAVKTLDKSGSCWDIHQDGAWLSANRAAVLDGVRGNSASQGWNDGCVAALLADPECHDMCVVASHL